MRIFLLIVAMLCLEAFSLIAIFYRLPGCLVWVPWVVAGICVLIVACGRTLGMRRRGCHQ